MKKLILLFTVFTFVVTSCSSDDSKPSEDQDPLIGVWVYYKYISNGVEQTLDECEKQIKLTVNVNGTFIDNLFVDVDGVCVDDGGEGIWKSLGNNMYSFTYYVGTEDEETEEETLTFEGNTVIFGGDVGQEIYIKE